MNKIKDEAFKTIFKFFQQVLEAEIVIKNLSLTCIFCWYNTTFSLYHFAIVKPLLILSWTLFSPKYNFYAVDISIKPPIWVLYKSITNRRLVLWHLLFHSLHQIWIIRVFQRFLLIYLRYIKLFSNSFNSINKSDWFFRCLAHCNALSKCFFNSSTSNLYLTKLALLSFLHKPKAFTDMS